MVGSPVCSDALTLMASRSYAASGPERRDSGRRLLRLGVCVTGPRGRVNRAALSRSTIGYRAQFRSGGWRVNGQEVALGEDALGDEDGVEGLGEAAVDRGVGDGFDDLGRGQADVE